ncbi:hypothetical protein [Staphylococcus simulans]|uniref:hypothetical protein n=1 Tax=Staphylococcus simulans TaxID=1286 RepID=UPI000D039ABD|nr:hypothetical protein [Staphylococcus simulans]
MLLSPMTFLLLWILFSLLFIIFTFLTLSALGNQTRFKLRLSIATLSFLLGLICFFGIFTDNSIKTDWKRIGSFKPSISVKETLNNFFDKKDTTPKTTKNDSETPPAPPKNDSNTHQKKSENYISKGRHYPVGYNPTADKGQKTTKGSGIYTVGKDIQPGYYKISIKEKEIGTIMLENENGRSNLSSTLDGYQESKNKSINLHLAKDQKLIIKRTDQVSIDPIPIKTTTTLKQGLYIVGTDIKPGRYIAKQTSKDSTNNLTLYNDNYRLKTNEILTNRKMKSSKSVKPKPQTAIDIKKNDIITIYGKGTTQLEPQ